MRRLNNNKATDMKQYQCPECGKFRMIRPIDHVVSCDKVNYKTKTGETISLISDVCDFCKNKNYQKYFAMNKDDARRILKNIQSSSNLDNNQSLEDLL